MCPSPIFFFFVSAQFGAERRHARNVTLANLWIKYLQRVNIFNLPRDSSPTATCNICNTTVSRGGNKRAAFNTTNLKWQIKKQTLKEYNEFAEAIQAKTPRQQTLVNTLRRKEKCPRDSDIAKNITEKVNEFIARDQHLSHPLSARGSGFSVSPGVFEPPVYSITSALHDYISRLHIGQPAANSAVLFASRSADLDRGRYIGGLLWSADLPPRRVHLFPPPLLSKSETSMCWQLRAMGGGVDDVHCYATHSRAVLKPGNS